MQARYQQIIQHSQKEYDQCSGLPFPLYLVSADGVFLRYNDECRHFFGLPEEPDYERRVTDFYLHPNDRRENLQRLHVMERGAWLKNTVIDMKVGEEVRYVRDYTKAIWSDSGKELLGLLCLMVNISRGGRYHRFFKDLPVGIFSFREEAGLVNANPRFWEMHGYGSFREIRQKTADAFVKDPSELEEMNQRLVEQGSLVNQYQEHLRKDGTLFTAAVSARAVLSNDGRYIGFEGILEDVSTEAIYFELVNEVPIGLYKIRINEEGEHILVHCNHQFATKRGASSPAGIIGKDMRQFHKSEQDFQRFQRELARADREGQYLVDYILEAYNGKGELRKYEVHAKLLKDKSGTVTGSIGAERDVTDYWETRQQLEELTTDIGKVLHSYSSTLIHSKHTMDAVFRSLAGQQDPIGSNGYAEEEVVLEHIHQQIGQLDNSLGKLLGEEKDTSRLSEAAESQLSHLMNLLRKKSEKMAPHQLAIIRDGTLRLRSVLEQEAKGRISRELFKLLKRQAWEILRLSSLLTLARGAEAILEMETVVNNLRSYVLTKIRVKEPLQRLDVYDMLLGVARNMEEYAANRGVELRLNLKQARNEYIDGYEDSLSRALLNIVHNAIKYSWTRSGDARAYVQVSGRKNQEWLQLEVENWGVAITRKELEEGLLFKVGYRGVNSSDRRRPGTGLGLYDAMKVVKKHGGELLVDSRPSLGNREDDYSNPFITTVTIKLPRKRQLL